MKPSSVTNARLAGGGEACSDIEYLRAQWELFGDDASDSTLYRTVTGLGVGGLTVQNELACRSGRRQPSSSLVGLQPRFTHSPQNSLATVTGHTSDSGGPFSTTPSGRGA
ncbi:hypothetical protein [Candidatus Poriferisodalis sp.]|uniref:hypothetical protein n=1 Tax=Candidatus Poriferisodalis sp. TaxID=3101277 RepID=UPI003B5BC2F3